MNKQVFVSPSDAGWRVKTVGTSEAAGIFETKAKAVDKARTVSVHKRAEMIVQNRNGKIGWRNSYGNDGFPPRG